MLHNAAEVDLFPITQCININLDGAVQEAVNQYRVLIGQLGSAVDVVLQSGLIVDDFHATAAEDVGRTDQHRVTDTSGNLASFCEGSGGTELRRRQLGLSQHLAELTAVLSQVDCLWASADDRNACGLQTLRQAQRGLATELNNDACDLSGLALSVVDLEDILEGQWLEVEAICGVVVGGNRFRVAVDHDGLVANAGKLEGRVDTGVVELNALADTVRTRTEDDDLFLLGLRGDLGLSSRVQLVCRVVVRSLCFELGGAGIDSLEYGVDVQAPAQLAHAVFPGQFRTQRSNLGVGQSPVLSLTQQVGGQHRSVDKLLADILQVFHLGDKPRIQAGSFVDLLDGSTQTLSQLNVVDAAFSRTLQIFKDSVDIVCALTCEVLIRNSPETSWLVLQRTHDLTERADVVTADSHGLTDGLHGGGQRIVSTWELLESKAWSLDNHVVLHRLKRCRGFTGDVVGDLIEGVADSQLGSNLCNRETSCLGSKRRRAGDTRVHLNGDDAAVIRVDGELDVTATGVNADLTQNCDALVTHGLELAVGQSHRRGDSHRVTSVDTEGINVFNGADHDDVVVAIAHELELKFLPAEDGLLDQNIGLGRCGQAATCNTVEVFLVEGQTGTQTAHGERRANNDRKTELCNSLMDFFHVVADAGTSGLATNLGDDVLEHLAILTALNGRNISTNQLDIVLLQNALAVQLNSCVQSSLATESCQDSVNRVALCSFLGQDLFDVLGFNRLDIGGVCELRVSHNRCRVGVDQRDSQALFAQHAASLGAGVVELAGLTDNNRAGADNQYVVDVCTTWHGVRSLSPFLLVRVSGCGLVEIDLLDQRQEVIKERVRIVRAGCGLRVVLHRKGHAVLQCDTFHDVVVKAGVRNLCLAPRGIETLAGLAFKCEAVVLSGDKNTASVVVLHRNIDAAVTEDQLVGTQAECAAKNLVTEADTE